MQSDPRMMEVFGVLTGIDLGKMGEEHMREKDHKEEDMKKKEEELKKQKEEEERRKKEEEERNMPKEEKEKLEKKKHAEEKKTDGNNAYKNKKFDEALVMY